MGEDYGFLFQEDDLFRRKTESINYDYYEEHPEEKKNLAEAEELFARSLSRILPRLEILGFTLEAARAEYQAVVAEAVEISNYSELEELKKEYLTFEEFCNLACRYPLSDLKSDYIEYETPDRDVISQGRFADEIDVFERIPWTNNSDSYWSEASFLSAKVCILSAESMLQVFALNAANTDCERCEAYSYVGFQHLIDGDRDSARHFFSQAVKQQAFIYYEHALASAMLSKLASP